MTEPRGFDLDGETSRAWSTFAGRLADRLVDMSAGETLTLGLDLASDEGDAGSTRLVFTVLPGAMLRRSAESPDAAGTVDRLTPQRDADQLAADTVRLLRESYSVMHPAFLTVTGETYELTDIDPGSSGGVTTPAAADVVAAQITEPVDSSHVLELAFATITHGLGREPTRDIDGDLVLESGSTKVFLRVLERTPVIQLFSRLVHDIAHPEDAPSVVAALNNDYPFVKFVFADQAVLASVHLPAIPFVPAQLRHMVAIFSELADELDDELVRRLGGNREIDRAADPEDADAIEPDGVPPELMVLVRLDPEGLGLDPEQTAEVCGYDRALTRQLLHIAIGQEEVWQRTLEENVDDPEEKARCAEEAAGWRATRRSLVGALELIDSLEV